MSACRQTRQAMKGTAEGHPPPANGSDGKQLTTPGRSCQMHNPQLADAFYAVIYTDRAPGKARLLFQPQGSVLSATSMPQLVCAVPLSCPSCDRHSSSAFLAWLSCCVQKRKNKLFKDGVLRLCSARSLLYDEVSRSSLPLVYMCWLQSLLQSGCEEFMQERCHWRVHRTSWGLTLKRRLLQEGKVIAERAGQRIGMVSAESGVAIGRPLWSVPSILSFTCPDPP